MVFYWSLSDSKPHQVSRTLLSILAVFNNAVVWMVSTRSPTSKSSRPFNKPLVTIPKAPITIGIIVTFMFHSFFQFSSKVKVLISVFTFLQFYSVVCLDNKFDNFADFLFLLIIIRSGLRAEIRWSICISKFHRSLWVSFSKIGSGLCIYHLLAWSNLNFLHISSESPCPPSHVSLYTPSVKICCIRLLCDWWLHLCHRIVCTCYFVASHLSSFLYD